MFALCCGGPMGLVTLASGIQSQIYWSAGGGIWHAPVDAPTDSRQIPAFEVREIEVDYSRLVWSDVEPRVPILPTGVIRSADPSGASVLTLATDLPQPSGVAVHAASNTFYWSDLERNAIFRRALDGSGPIQEILGGMPFIASIHSIDIDPREQKLYFGFVNPLIDSLFPGSIARINLDGTDLETVVSGLTEPRGIAVHAEADLVYWTDVSLKGHGVIGRAASDGGNAEFLVEDLILPHGIDLDVAAEQLYWVDAGTGKLQRARLDGSNVTDVLTGLLRPQAVAVLAIPEPATLSLAVAGMTGLLGLRMLRRKGSG
jgi:hypothetical protein